MTWQSIMGVLAVILVPLYGLVLYLVKSNATLNREVGELKQNVQHGNREIAELQQDVKENAEGIGKVVRSIDDIKRSSAWEPEEEG